MNPTLVIATLRQRARSRLRLALLAFTFGAPLLSLLFIREGSLPDAVNTGTFALILGAGMIGGDVSSGVVQLLLARPVRRSDYVLSRWLAVALGAAALGLVQLASGCLILAFKAPVAGLEGQLPAWHEIAITAGEHVLVSGGVSAVLALWSALAPGIGDVGLWFLGYLAGGLTELVGNATSQPVVGRIGREVMGFFSPSLNLGRAFSEGTSWFEIASYVSTVTLCLALAIVAMNRKELSYASG